MSDILNDYRKTVKEWRERALIAEEKAAKLAEHNAKIETVMRNMAGRIRETLREDRRP